VKAARCEGEDEGEGFFHNSVWQYNTTRSPGRETLNARGGDCGVHLSF
jgi:hypothetical protein